MRLLRNLPFAIAALIMALAANAQSTAPRHEDANWPCQQRLVPKLAAAAYWSGPEIENLGDWHADSEDFLLTPEQTSAGITDVHSASDAISPFENTAYNTW